MSPRTLRLILSAIAVLGGMLGSRHPQQKK